MDYYPDGAATELANCTGPPGQGCPVTEPPNCLGEDTGEDHNPLYHYLRYVVGDSTADLAAAGITPGAWDQDTAPLVVWRIEFNFECTSCNDPNQVFYNFTLIEILPGGGAGEVRAAFSEITLGEINGDPHAMPPIPPLTIQIAQSSGLMITASSVPPTLSDPVPTQDYVLEDPVYPPASQPPAPGTVVSSQLLKLDENNPGEFTAEFQASGTPEPSYLIQSGGLADPADGVYEIPPGSSEPNQLTSSTYTCPDCFPAMTVTDAAPSALSNQVVPEPGFGAGLAAGLAGLLVARRHRSRKRRRV
ncbi:MAG: PEP-CTERM sorting domain-containing protein, partial [Myxococcota bacterium]|nr:PEP-CTERM sorting domain-containing protein [Myxococcota bacterium]